MTDKQKNMPSIETQQRMHAFFMKTSAPRLIEEKRKEEEAEKERRNLENSVGDNQDEGERVPMRRIRGVKALVKYLESIDCPMSESTIYKLLREKRIPAIRPR